MTTQSSRQSPPSGDRQKTRLLPRILHNCRQEALPYITDALLLLFCVGGTVSCLVTGFRIPTETKPLCTAVLLCALLFPFLRRRKYGVLFHAGIAAVLLFVLWRQIDSLWESFRFVAAGVAQYLCLGFGNISPPTFLNAFCFRLAHANDAALASYAAVTPAFLVFFIFVLALLFSYTFLYRRSLFLTAALPVPVFVLCFLVIDSTLPALWALTALLLFWGMLLFGSSSLGKHADPKTGARQMLSAVLPLLVLFSLVYVLCPQKGYQPETFTNAVSGMYRSIETVSNRVITSIRDVFEHTGKSSVSFSGGGLFSGSTVEGGTLNLEKLGKRNQHGNTVLKVQSEKPGVFYLREKAYDVYDGTAWSSSGEGTVHLDTSADVLRIADAEPFILRIDSSRASDLFTPYYFSACSAPWSWDPDGIRYKNHESLESYSFYCYRFSGNFGDLTAYRSTDADALRACRSILEEDEQTAESLLSDIRSLPAYDEYVELLRAWHILDTPVPFWTYVEKVTEAVRACASYSLSPEKMPSDADDFVLWFLTEAESGYCAHFASAEAVLLRVLGIPCRVAVGYLVDLAAADTWYDIKDTEAHAWVEVFDARLGWIPVEATPAAGTARSTTPAKGTNTPSSVPDPAQSVTSEITQTEETTVPDSGSSPIRDTTEPDSGDPGSDPDDPTSKGPPGSGNSGEGSGTGSSGTGTGTGKPGGSGPGPLLRFLRAIPSAVWIVLLLIIVSAGFLLIRRRVLLGRHPGQLSSARIASDPNGLLLLWYRSCLHLGKILGISVPAELTALAEKARFSNHRITEEEVAALSRWYETHVQTLAARDSVPARLKHRWIDVLY